MRGESDGKMREEKSTRAQRERERDRARDGWIERNTGKKVVEGEKRKACVTPASCSTELQFDTQTSMVSEHVSWVKWGSDSPKASRIVHEKCVW